MAKKIKDGEPENVPVNNIEGLAELKREFLSGKMPERKTIALKAKLISLFKEEKSTEDEQALMELILTIQRSRGTIASHEVYLLSKIESDRCELTAFCRSDDAPVVHHLKKNLECKYEYDALFNDGKNKPDSIGRYHVYVPRVVPTEHQLSVATVRKEMKGHPVDPSEYPEPRTLIHRLSLKQREFERWFEIEDKDILNTKPKEPSYTF